MCSGQYEDGKRTKKKGEPQSISNSGMPNKPYESHLDQRYFVDFDHTLYLKNSTEVFLGCARPAFLVAPLLKILAISRPWNALPGGANRWRDIIRVLTVIVLTPWTIALFSIRAESLFAKHHNRELEEKLANVSPEKIVIASFGLHFIIKGLLKHSRYSRAKLIAPSLMSSPRVRKFGKLDLLKRNGYLPDAQNDIFYTDNAIDDADVVAHVAQSHVVQWAENDETGAFHNMYLPFFYTAKIKRSPRFLLRQVFLEEMLVIMLAFGLFLPLDSYSILGTMTGISFLFLSFHTIYEIGYADNDTIGLKNEKNPKLSDNFYRYDKYQLQPYAWIWSILLAFIGVCLIAPEHAKNASSLLPVVNSENFWLQRVVMAMAWMAIPTAGLLCFLIFNRTPLRLRVFVYLPLHGLKYFGPAIFFPLHPLGILFIASQIIRTWSLYLVRRSGGDTSWVLSQFIRLCFFVAFILILYCMSETRTLATQWQCGILLLFCIIRSAPEFHSKMKQEGNL